ncbi:MAG: C39 family peptidase [Limnohabitans sp.]
MAITDLQLTPEQWLNTYRYFKGEPQQVEAVEMLRQFVNEVDPTLLTQNANWLEKYRSSPPEPVKGHPIKVPYFNQLLMDDGEGWRDCFSATCAMIAAWKGKVKDENTYNHIRRKHGDSTVAGAQIAALKDLGLDAHYSTSGTRKMLCSLLDHGVPVGTGILHHGRANAPTGGGHWMLAIGYDEAGVMCLDPYGELDVVAGTWAHQGSGGDHVHYSWKNWLPRWEVAGGDGYCLWVE